MKFKEFEVVALERKDSGKGYNHSNNDIVSFEITRHSLRITLKSGYTWIHPLDFEFLLVVTE